MASKAKELRDEQEVKLVGAYYDLMAEVEAKPTKKRAVTRAMEKLNKTWAALEKCHADYCRLNKVPVTESMEYIKTQGKLRRDALGAAGDILGLEEDSGDQLAMDKLQREMFQLKVDIEGCLTVVAGLAVGDLGSEKYTQTVELLNGGELKLKKYMEDSDSYIEYLEGEARSTAVKETQEFYKSSSTKMLELRGSVVKLTPVKQEPSVTGAALVNTNVDDISTALPKREPVKIKAMECPKWDGRYRTFVRFKKLWDENIGPRHEDSALHYMLCQSLPKKVLDNISTLSNSAEDIWAYLDQKYGRPEVVAREVMAELMGLDHKKLGSLFMGKFCTLLLDTHSLLVTLNEVDWLVTNRAVADLEDKLPKEERIEWAKQMISAIVSNVVLEVIILERIFPEIEGVVLFAERLITGKMNVRSGVPSEIRIQEVTLLILLQGEDH